MQNYRTNSMQYSNAYRRPMPSPAPEPAVTCEMETGNDTVLAMAYVKWQTWQKIYDPEKALHNGTIFQELNLPFCGIGGCQK